MPSHCLNQCWNIVNPNLRYKLQWNLSAIDRFLFKKMLSKISSAKWLPFWFGLNVLRCRVSCVSFKVWPLLHCFHHSIVCNTLFCAMGLLPRAANQYGTSVFCTDFTCKIREYEFGLQNKEIELCQFCHLKYCCQNKADLFWVAIQSILVAFYALNPSNTSLITKTFNLLSSTCGSSMRSCQLPVPVVPNESTRVSTGSGWVPPE